MAMFLLLILFLFSVACGVLLFVRLTGSDAWLTKGLRDDKFGAIVVMCTLIVCAILLFILLRASLSPIMVSLAAASKTPDNDFPRENVQEAFAGGIVYWLLLLCIPIISGYLLYWLYRTVHWVIKKSLLLRSKLKSW